MRTTALYRMFNSDARLLYVGISLSACERFSSHATTKSWWPEVERIELTHYESRAAAQRAERAAIRTENPVHNVAWNTPTRARPLRALRQDALLSQKALADLAGVSRQSILYYEIGNTSPSVATARRIADALGCSLDDLAAAFVSPTGGRAA